MAALSQQYQALLQAYDTLDDSMNTLTRLLQEKPITSIKKYEEELVASFNESYTLTCTFFRNLLVHKFNVHVTEDQAVFNACVDQGLITDEQLDAFDDMLEAKTLSTHTYNAKMPIELHQKIRTYLPSIKQIIEHLQT